ncbi:MAG: tannase/feruloyl esterase family alpha/beta hydrolase [Agarilytica sp.]
MNNYYQILCLVLFVVLAPLASATVKDCSAIKGLSDDKLRIQLTEKVPASADLPEYCRVIGVIDPKIGFEIRLPTKDWNGKFYMVGCGGFCGVIKSDAPGFANRINYGLKRNYAVATTDSGHRMKSNWEAAWALNNRFAEFNWGHRAIHKTTNVTKRVIARYYGQKPNRSYFAGCSTGGRMAAMEALRYPNDFDGIIAGAPGLNYTSLVGSYFAWMMQHNTDENGNEIIAQADVPIINQYLFKECDGKDGLRDGLIDDPRACNFRPEKIMCTRNKTTNCLSKKQVDAVKKLHEIPRNSIGEPLFAGRNTVGSSYYWPKWLSSTGIKVAESPLLIPKIGRNFLRYMAFDEDPGESYSPLDFDFDFDPPKMDLMGKVYNSDNPDLSEFKQKGGKFLLWHGWSDTVIPPGITIDYYERMIQLNGSLDATQDFARFFLFPGMDHCGAFPGRGAQQNGFDILSALENWVENDTAPDKLMSTKYDRQGNEVWTRPVCAYPNIAKYQGGNSTKQESFECQRNGFTHH